MNENDNKTETEQWRARDRQNAGPGNLRIRRLVESRAFQRGIMAVIFALYVTFIKISLSSIAIGRP